MGDSNAKIGSDNRGYQEIMRQQGLGEIIDKGERFVGLCATSNLVIGGSFLQHKATWVSPDLQTENQIDHVQREEIPKNSSRCACQVRGRCGLRPPSLGCTVEA